MGTIQWAHFSHRTANGTPDGKTLSFLKLGGPAGGCDIWMLSADGDRKPKPLIELPASIERYSAFSPDGRWVAYVSTEIGNRFEVFVQPFPPTGAKYQISTDGGGRPLWSRDGKQLFYDVPVSRIAAVDIRTAPTFSFGKPITLSAERAEFGGVGRNFDVTPDGKQFLVVVPVSPSDPTRQSQQINIILNWLEELKQRVPVK